MNDQQIDELIRQALKDQSRVPVHLEKRLEQHIDQLAAEDRKEVRIPMYRNRIKRWCVAASILLVLGVGTTAYFSASDARPKDTFDNPEEAAMAAEQALTLLSQNLNKGFGEMNQARQKMEKIHAVWTKHINDQTK